MASLQTARKAHKLLMELRSIMEREGEANWIRGIKSAENAFNRTDLTQGYLEARAVYRSMMHGNGSFSDYYIERNNLTEQESANQRLDQIRAELWRLFHGS